MKEKFKLIHSLQIISLRQKDDYCENRIQFFKEILIYLLIFYAIQEFVERYSTQFWLYLFYHIKTIPEPILPNSFDSNIILLVLVGPILEELSCRLILRFKPIYFSISTGILIYILLNGFVLHLPVFSSIKYLFIALLIIVFLTLTVSFIIKSKHELLRNFWEKRFKIIFYFYTILFSVLHLGNYNLSIKYLPVVLLIIFPYFVSGYLLGLVRLRFGIIFSILFHALWNLTASLNI